MYAIDQSRASLLGLFVQESALEILGCYQNGPNASAFAYQELPRLTGTRYNRHRDRVGRHPDLAVSIARDPSENQIL